MLANGCNAETSHMPRKAGIAERLDSSGDSRVWLSKVGYQKTRWRGEPVKDDEKCQKRGANLLPLSREEGGR